MRKVGMAIGAFVLLLIVGVVIFVATFNVNQYRGRIRRNSKNGSIGKSVWAICIWAYFLHASRYKICRSQMTRNSMPRSAFVEAQELDVSINCSPCFTSPSR